MKNTITEFPEGYFDEPDTTALFNRTPELRRLRAEHLAGLAVDLATKVPREPEEIDRLANQEMMEWFRFEVHSDARLRALAEIDAAHARDDDTTDFVDILKARVAEVRAEIAQLHAILPVPSVDDIANMEMAAQQ